MRSIVFSQFRKQPKKLPTHTRQEAGEGLQKRKDNPHLVGLKRFNGPVCGFYQVRVLSGEGAEAVCTSIESHKDYNNHVRIRAGIIQTASHAYTCTLPPGAIPGGSPRPASKLLHQYREALPL